MGDNAMGTSIDELRDEIRNLKDALRTESYKRDVVSAAEQLLLESPVVRLGKWFLLLAITTGLAVWIGGSVYGGIQLKSIADRTGEILRQFDQKMQEQTKQVDDDATKARGEITEQKTKAVNAAKDAIDDAGNEKKLVRDKLGVDQLPDIRQLKDQLEALAQAGGRLNLHCLSLLSGHAVWVLFGAAALSLALSLYAVVKVHL